MQEPLKFWHINRTLILVGLICLGVIYRESVAGIIQAIIPAAVPTANKQGNGSKFQLASGAVSNSQGLCTDASGNTTTTGCTNAAVPCAENPYTNGGGAGTKTCTHSLNITIPGNLDFNCYDSNGTVLTGVGGPTQVGSPSNSATFVLSAPPTNNMYCFAATGGQGKTGNTGPQGPAGTPVMLVSATNTTPNTITNGNFNAMQFDTQTGAVNSWCAATVVGSQCQDGSGNVIHDTAANKTRFVATVAGYYQATCSVDWTITNRGAAYFAINANAAPNAANFFNQTVRSNNASPGTVTTGIFKLNLNDYVECYTVNTSGSDSTSYSATMQFNKMQ